MWDQGVGHWTQSLSLQIRKRTCIATSLDHARRIWAVCMLAISEEGVFFNETPVLPFLNPSHFSGYCINFLCCAINYHKLSSLRQHLLLFYRSVEHSSAGFSAQRHGGLTSRCLQNCLLIWSSRSFVFHSFRLFQEFNLLHLEN